MYYLSIDVANKSLAVSFIYYNKNHYENFENIIRNNKLTFNNLIEINKKLDNIIKYYICEVTDLMPNIKVKHTTILFRTKKLKEYIEKLKERINTISQNKKITIIIEKQPSFNDKSKTVYNQLLYSFIEPNYKVNIINPVYKNQVYFNNELRYSTFIQKYANNYIANKNHTKANFLYFLKTFNKEYLIKHIKKKNYDDIADSFMQIFGYLYCKNKH
jgi:hypothetical protein